jgi:DNA-binding response OmpR family regulator
MTAEPETAGPFFYAPQDAMRILFVDEDPILREFAIANLSGDHAEVDTAAGCDEALAAIALRRPDVVFLSLESPSYEVALAVLEALREHPVHWDIPVIAITGREDVEAVDAAFAAGAASFVVKPLNWRLLGRQARFTHRAATGRRAEPAGCDSTPDQLVKLAREGVRFIAHAMAIDPSLKAAAVPFAEAADAALEPRQARGSG